MKLLKTVVFVFACCSAAFSQTARPSLIGGLGGGGGTGLGGGTGNVGIQAMLAGGLGVEATLNFYEMILSNSSLTLGTTVLVFKPTEIAPNTSLSPVGGLVFTTYDNFDRLNIGVLGGVMPCYRFNDKLFIEGRIALEFTFSNWTSQSGVSFGLSPNIAFGYNF
jgi:hypothetical protein